MVTNIKLSLDTRRAKRNGAYPIVYRLTHYRKTTAIKSGFEVLESDWDSKNSKIKSSSKAFDSTGRVNNFLSTNLIKFRETILQLELKNQLIGLSIVEVKNLLFQKDEEFSFYRFCEDHIEDLRRGKRFGSARAYKSMLNVVRKFMNQKPLSFKQITPNFLTKLETDYLSRGNSLNGLSAIIRSLRSCYNLAIKNGYIEKQGSPFDSYTIRQSPTEKRAIPKSAIALIMDLKFDESDPLFHTRNYFVFSYLSFGMNFADMAELTVGDIKDGRIQYVRKKTGMPFDLIVTEGLQKIIEHYSTGKHSKDYLFPIISRSNPEDQYKSIMWARKRYNIKLKKIAELCGIDTKLTSYTGRHSAATAALFLNIPLAAISKMLGHKSISTTQTYLKSLPDNVIDQYQVLLEKQLAK